MKFMPTPLPGAYVIELEPIEDERGFFARTVCAEQFARHGLNASFVQQSISRNRRAGTLRGLHYQAPPHSEDKLVRVTRGAVFDVIVDMRRDSPAYGCWFGVELSANDGRQLYIPAGMAHGFQTLLPDTDLLYEMTVAFQPDAARGVRWDDPALGIPWPACDARIISDKDRTLPLLGEAQ